MILSREQKALELNSEHFGVSVDQLMENAGQAVAAEISKKIDPAGKTVHIYAGPGGNGGDAFVVARILAHTSHVKVFVLGEVKSTAALRKFEDVRETAASVKSAADLPEEKPDIIVDGIFGTGIRGELREPFRSAIGHINNTNALKVSIDVPSGIDPDTGKGFGVKADLVVSLHDSKRAAPGAVVCDIGIPPEAGIFCGPGDIYLALPRRKPDSHKGQNGAVLVIGGSEMYTGAPILASLAALRSGADLAILAAPHRAAGAASAYPDLMTIPLHGNCLSPDHIGSLPLEKADAILVGPGIGTEASTEKFLRLLLKQVKVPTVIDADAIKLSASNMPSGKFTWTPHRKEFELLAGKPDEDSAKGFAAKHGTLLLKGHTDLVTDGQRLKYNKTGNPGMTVGGTGDVLAGIVAGFLAQGAEPFPAACAAAYANCTAADLLFKEYGYGFLASDLLKGIPRVIRQVI